jgi:molybdopterin/thiamine biosynthesis adenylyltransferase
VSDLIVVPGHAGDRPPSAGSVSALDRRRIEYIVGNPDVDAKHVTLIGAGSGGFPVMQQLSMLGVRRWSLFDPDVLEGHNLVKHPARRADLGRLKVGIAREWLLDRNPTSEVEAHPLDVVQAGDTLSDALRRTDLVVCAVDSAGVRHFINERCVEHRVPCATGLVFRTGMGGTVYLYLPGETGCLTCLETYTQRNGLDLDNRLDLTPDETNRIYGLGEREYSASGLATDIMLVASLHAALSTSLLCGNGSAFVAPLTFNWLTFSTRRVEGVFDARFAAERAILRPQENCYLRCSQRVITIPDPEAVSPDRAISVPDTPGGVAG